MPLDVVRRLLTPLHEPRVTSRYPDAPPLLAGATHGLPEVDAALCQRDGACVLVCPSRAIEIGDAGWSIDAGRCVFCSVCASACPHTAIQISSRVELADRDRATLVELIQVER